MQALSFVHTTDDQLVTAMPRLARNERTATADFVAGLAEFDRRKLYLGLGFPSIYSYCATQLYLKEGAAYRRIETARASRRHSVILEMLRDGRLSVATVALIGPSLRGPDGETLLEEVSGKSKREVELILARRNPQPPVPSVVRKLPEPKPVVMTAAAGPAPTQESPLALADLAASAAPAPTPPSRRPIVAPLSESHYKLQVTISAAARERLQQIQDLMRHRIPKGDPAAIVEHALDVLHAQLLREKAAIVAKPRAGKAATEGKGRYIPASVRRDVFRRDKGRCAYVAPDGRTCGSTSGVEFHHVRPYAVGGEAAAANLERRCRAHNGFEWEQHLDAETRVLVER